MARVDVHHLTLPPRLPIIEEEGLRTRADVSPLVGPLEDFDTAAPGAFAHGRRVSAYLSLEHARTQVDAHGSGHVVYSVDPKKTLAAPASARDGDPAAYWEQARPLSEWLADGDVPDDLDVHVNVGVRAKHLELKAPLVRDEDLDGWAPLVTAVADEDSVSAKALMHLAIIASEGDFESPAFLAACALAWRDEPDADALSRELLEMGHDAVASAAIAEYGSTAPDVTQTLRDALESTREWADENGVSPDRGVITRTALILNTLPAA